MTAMAESDAATELVEPGTTGAIECKAPGCSNWFVKRSGRHIYCKAPGCTYRRGAPPPVELGAPSAAAEELLLRLQDKEGSGDVGPEAVGIRLRAVSAAQRNADGDAYFGALVDAAAALVACADRVRSGTLVRIPDLEGLSRAQQPQALVQAVLASHKRTVTLAERRIEAIWAMLRARDALSGAQAGAEATVGTEASVGADEAVLAARAAYESARGALQAVEAAWAERVESLRQLEAAGSPQRATVRGANGRGRPAA